MSVHESPVYLYARNFYAELHNFEIVQGLKGYFTVYDSKDSGNQKYLDKILAPAKLTLKSAKGMLLKILNGMIGNVLEL